MNECFGCDAGYPVTKDGMHVIPYNGQRACLHWVRGIYAMDKDPCRYAARRKDGNHTQLKAKQYGLDDTFYSW